MALRKILSEKEKENLIESPSLKEDIIRWYTLAESDIIIIEQNCRGTANKLGFAIQLCYLRFPGKVLKSNETPEFLLLQYVCEQLNINQSVWEKYAVRDVTRREHITLIRKIFGFKTYSEFEQEASLKYIHDKALQTDRAVIIAEEFITYLRTNKIQLPSINTIERLCSEVLINAEKQIYDTLSSSLSNHQKQLLDALLNLQEKGSVSQLNWLKQSPQAVNSKFLLMHIKRLRTIKEIDLPKDIGKDIHQTRLLKIAREGRQMTPQHLRDFEESRRYATLVAILLETKASIIDEIIEMNDKIIGSLFRYAKNTQVQKMQDSGKSMGEQLGIFFKIGNALLDARETGEDPFDAVESVISWEDLAQSISEAKNLTAKQNFDSLYFISDKYFTIKKYGGEFLKELELRSAPVAEDILKAVGILIDLYEGKIKRLPEKLPSSFIRKRWEELVFTENGTDRKFYELCIFSELKNHLRSGDLWVQGSRQYKDFEDYLIPLDRFTEMRNQNQFPLDVTLDVEEFLSERMELLSNKMQIVSNLIENNELPDSSIINDRIKIKPLENTVPEEAEVLVKKIYSLLPLIKITDLLKEVDQWTNFTDQFTHLKSGNKSDDKNLLLTVILSDAINLGLRKMSEASPGTSYAKLSWLQAWHIRDETYSSALAEIINVQSAHPFSFYWGEGKTSSSDGQRFATGSYAQRTGNINPKYGSSPGVQFYTHISDQYAPFHTKVINVGVRDATYVLDGLLYHESDVQIEEHYTDTSGFTDHVFALMQLLGFKFAPRIRDLNDKKLFIPEASTGYSALSEHIGGTINSKKIIQNWDEILRLAASIKNGTVTASLIVKKIGSYPRENGLAVALRELGKIERTLFMLDWYMSPELRRRVTAGLNKGEARNALARAVYFNRFGEVRERSFENQRYKASGLNLVTAAIVLWNTVYIEKAVQHLKEQGEEINEELLQHLSPLGWEHIHLTGDYVWEDRIKLKKGEFRSLRKA
ncbi:Tn3 family transposase [Chryseobacterium sp. 5_R23647]|jgi:TnpA family transposase|uniref:Tn3 family transposase n=1 Tax=Chryseobacterium sp. 5_R23647 TaxID=2258964 RepID=UPI000E2850CB|nr:Tn3 family transposase [Chryseobacterium sp. 5_R23647]REC40944.1 Tn3 family transposase [Chryseobacterium sp. 5_R23647]REC40962.1 Tn3 family transposase [Chryseobacterium sp. 5_R23647]